MQKHFSSTVDIFGWSFVEHQCQKWEQILCLFTDKGYMKSITAPVHFFVKYFFVISHTKVKNSFFSMIRQILSSHPFYAVNGKLHPSMEGCINVCSCCPCCLLWARCTISCNSSTKQTNVEHLQLKMQTPSSFLWTQDTALSSRGLKLSFGTPSGHYASALSSCSLPLSAEHANYFCCGPPVTHQNKFLKENIAVQGQGFVLQCPPGCWLPPSHGGTGWMFPSHGCLGTAGRIVVAETHPPPTRLRDQ